MAEGNPTRATAESGTNTVTVDKSEENEQSTPVLQLRLQPPKNEQKVKWTTDTVDNEFMGKKKSKCCCIYEKPKVFGESDTSSSSDNDDEGCTPHCRGHKKKCYRHHENKHEHDHDGENDEGAG